MIECKEKHINVDIEEVGGNTISETVLQNILHSFFSK